MLLTRAVAADADDTVSAFALMHELYRLGAYDAALALAPAPTASELVVDVKLERERGLILAATERWAPAKERFEALAKIAPADTEIAEWLELSRAQAKAAAAPTDAAAQLELAAVLVTRADWDGAAVAYRKVLDGKTAATTQRQAAIQGQERISIADQLERVLGLADDDLKQHNLIAARGRIDSVLRLSDKLGNRKREGAVLQQLAQRARSFEEVEISLELLRMRVARTLDDQGAYTALAFALLENDRLDEAEQMANQAVAMTGDETRYAHAILAHVARMRGKFADAKKLALNAGRKYAWHTVVARVEAADDDWEGANTTALGIELDSPEVRATVTATARGLQAWETLLANPKSNRDRLRLVRALADLGLVTRVQDEIAKLPRVGTWRSEGWWSLAVSTDMRVLKRDRLAAARESKPTTPLRKRALEELEALEKLRAKSTDDATRIALARHCIVDRKYHLALATLGPLVAKQTVAPAVEALVHDARAGLALDDQLQVASAAFERHEYVTALRISTEVQQAHDRIGGPAGRIAARVLRSESLGQLGKYDEAIKIFKEANGIAVADGDVRQVAVLAQKIGEFRAATGTSDELFAALARNRKLCGDLDDESCLYRTYSRLATLERDEGHTAASLDHARLAWNLADRLGRADFARAVRLDLALTSLEANRVSEGEQVALKLLADSRARGDTVVEQATTMLVGGVAMLRGDGPRARALFREAYNLGTRFGQTAWRATARHFEGLAWLEADRLPAESAKALDDAAELYALSPSVAAVSERGTCLRRLVDARLQSGDIAGARNAAEEGMALAETFGRRLQLATAQGQLALVALTEAKPDEAVKRAMEAVAIAEQTDSVNVLWNAFYVLGRAYQLKNRDKDALGAYEQALKHLGRALLAAGTDNERSGYMHTGRVREVHRNAVELLLKLGKNARAMEVLEMSRDAVLKQTFDATRLQSTDVSVQALLDRYNAARTRVNAGQKQLDKAAEKRNATLVKALAQRIAKARSEVNNVALKLKVTHRELFQALAIAPHEISARSTTLPAGSVIIEYFVATDALSIFVISPKRKAPIIVRVKVGAAELAKTIDDYRAAVISENNHIKLRDVTELLGRKLDGWLLKPIHSHIADASTLVIVPYGPLYYVAFDGLVVSAAGEPLRYVLEDYRIAVQTTGTLETLLSPVRPRSTGRMLAIADPDGTLPGAKREVKRIIKTAVPDTQVLGGMDATVKMVQESAGTSRYLHLATHGTFDADPRKSGLKLADGQFTVREIATLKGLRTNNDLVVLSACNTATEVRDWAGEDMVSLASSFALAGAPTVVASLWEVDDASTADLMVTFYRALEKTMQIDIEDNKNDRLDALRTAKLNLLRTGRRYAAPWYWASFQLYGDFRAPATR